MQGRKYYTNIKAFPHFLKLQVMNGKISKIIQETTHTEDKPEMDGLEPGYPLKGGIWNSEWSPG